MTHIRVVCVCGGGGGGGGGEEFMEDFEEIYVIERGFE